MYRFSIRFIVVFMFSTMIWAGHLSLNAQIFHHNINEIDLLSPIAKEIYADRLNQHSFISVELFSDSQVQMNPVDGMNKWTLCEDRKNSLSYILSQNLTNIELVLPSWDGKKIVLELKQYELIADGFRVTTGNNKPVASKASRYYRGIVQGQPESIAAFSFFEGQVFGMLSLDFGNIVVQNSELHPGKFIMYNDRDATKKPDFVCETEKLSGNDFDPEDNEIQGRAAGDCVKVYIECDYALYTNKGSVNATVNWITAVYNNVATLYANESINTTISEIYVWTTPDSYSKTSSTTALTQFRTARPSFNGNLAHLAALGGNNIGGVAWLDVLCTNYNYAYSNISSSYNNVPTYSWTVEVMTHEMGHNVGSNHTQWCGWSGGALDNCYTPEGSCSPGPAPSNGGTIMSYCHLTSYGINFNNGFGTQPGNKIRSRVAAVNCLSPGCGASCPAPTGLNASNITNTTALISWSPASGAVDYTLEYKVSTSSTWTPITTNTTSYTLSGLVAGTTYNARVKTNCSSSSSVYSGIISFTTTGGSCGIPTNFLVNNITSTSATASWSAVTGATAYNFQYKATSSSSWQQVTVTATAINLTGLSPATSYDVRVQSVCGSSTSAFTNVITFTTQSGSSYCDSRGTSSTQEWIKRVKINTLDRNSGSDGGYYDGTSMSTVLKQSTAYQLYFQAGVAGNRRTLYWTAWIDFNQNGVFTDAGERVAIGASNSLNLLYVTFTVPSNATLGSTRLRVSMKYGGYPSSCETFARGEVEDYTVNIQALGSLPGSSLSEGLKGASFDYVRILPNPVQDLMLVQFDAKQAADVKLEVFNILQQRVAEYKMISLEGSNNYSFKIDHLIAGTYFCKITSGSQVYIQKMIKS